MMTISKRLRYGMLASALTISVPLGCGGGRASSKDAASTGGAVGTGGDTSVGGSMGSDASATGGATSDAAGAGGAMGTGGAGATSTGGARTGGAGTGGTGTGGMRTGGMGTGGVSNGGATGTGGCPGTGGPSMVRLPEGYCIDSTEVTRSQYAAWVATVPATGSQISDCAWNTTFVAATTCMASPYVCQSNCDNHPQVCVDWCDASAYCQSKGKRLCGKIGGGTNADTEGANASLSQWYGACSSHGANLYAYGSTYDGQTCNGYDRWEPMFSQPPYDYITLPVGSQPNCQSSAGGYRGVFDLSGNAAEWEDSCSSASGALGRCLVRGGSLSSNSSSMRCANIASFTRDLADLNVGFRCCAL